MNLSEEKDLKEAIMATKKKGPVNIRKPAQKADLW